MTNFSWTVFSDIVLAAGTIFLGLTVGRQKNYRTWPVLFFSLAATSIFAALYHGSERFHSPEFWTLLCCFGGASCLLFLAACAASTRPKWKWLHWLWPLLGVGGILIGGILAPMPRWYTLGLAGISILVAAFIVKNAKAEVRSLIYFGLVMIAFGLIAQTLTRFGGFFGGMALLHWFQLAGYYAFYKAAQR